MMCRSMHRDVFDMSCRQRRGRCGYLQPTGCDAQRRSPARSEVVYLISSLCRESVRLSFHNPTCPILRAPSISLSHCLFASCFSVHLLRRRRRSSARAPASHQHTNLPWSLSPPRSSRSPCSALPRSRLLGQRLRANIPTAFAHCPTDSASNPTTPHPPSRPSPMVLTRPRALATA